jgi:hypothetical protein
MLAFLRDRASERKLRLFACACCRHVWHLLIHPESRDAIETLERYADGLLDTSALRSAWGAASNVRSIRKTRKKDSSPQKSAAWAVSTALFPDTFLGVGHSASLVQRVGHVPPAEEEQRQCADLRDLFGNLFHSSRDSPWQNSDVRALAQAAYDNRTLPAGTLDGARLSILADALEEAGCAADALLEHLRGPGPHVPGCWAVDAVLGRG